MAINFLNNSVFAGNIIASSTSAVIQTPRISMEADGTLDWGQARDYGTLTWDTGYAVMKGQSGKGLKFQVNNNSTALTIDTSDNSTFASDVTLTDGVLTVNDGNNYVKISEGTNSIGQIELKDGNPVFVQGWSSEFRVAVGTYDNTAFKINSAKEATFAGKVRANNWFQGADGTNTLYSNATSGTLIQTPGSTANNNDSKIYFRNHGTTIKHTFDTNNGNATFAGNVRADNIGLGSDATSFGTGVPTLLFKGTNSTNGRAGALYFKENNGTDTAALYVTDGSDGYGTVLTAYQGSLKLATGSLTGTVLTLDQSSNATFAGDVIIPDYIYHVGDTNSYFGFNGADDFRIYAGNTLKMIADADNVRLYYNGSNKFETLTDGVYVAGKLGIGTSTPDTDGYSFAEDLVIKGGASASDGAGITIASNGKRYGVIAFGDAADSNAGEIFYDHNVNAMYFRTNGSGNNVLINSAGKVTAGAATGSSDGSSTLTTKGYVDTTATGAANWVNIGAGARSNYTLGFQPPSTGYGGFFFNKSDGNGAGYLLVRGGADSDVYKQGGITLVGDGGTLTIATRTSASNVIRFMTGASSVERLNITGTGAFSFGNSVTNYGTSGQVMTSNGNATPGWTTKVSTVSDDGGSTINVSGSATARTVAAVTSAVSSSSANLATGAQIQTAINTAIDTIPSGLAFEGNWNASTDSPDLSGASPDNGQFWIVSVAGSTNLSGITDWKVGDWAIYVATGAGTDGWQKVDNTSTLSGAGTVNALPLWTGTTSLGTSRFTQTSAQNIVTGPGNAGSDYSLQVKNAASTTQLYIQGTGEVVVSQNYFYVAASQGMYSNGLARFRGGITNDQSVLSVGGNGSSSNLQLTSGGASGSARFFGSTETTGAVVASDTLTVSGNTTLSGTTNTISGNTLFGGYTRLGGKLVNQYIASLSASGQQARQYEIARAFMDYNDWNNTGVIKINLMEEYFDEGIGKEYAIRWGYNNTVDIDLINIYGGGDNANGFECVLGTLTQIGTSDIYYLPIIVKLRYYARVGALVTTNRSLTTNATSTSGGVIYINPSPTAVNISNFSVVDSVEFSGPADNINLGTASTKVGIGFADATLPTQALDVNANMRLRGRLYDVNNNQGGSGDVLVSTGSGVDWVSASTPGTGTFLPLAGGTMDSGATIGMTGSLTIDGGGSSSDVLKLKGSARIQIENASATDSIYISNTGGNNGSILDLGSTLTIAENGGLSTFSGNLQAPRIGIGAVNASYNLYNNGTTYLNGATIVDAAFTQSGGDASTFSGNVTVGANTVQNGANPGLKIQSTNTSQTVLGLHNTTSRNWEVAVGGSGSGVGAGTWYVYDNTANDARLKIDTSGNATFAGNITANRIVTSGLYGTGHGSSILPIWQYNAGNPGYGIGYYEGNPDALRIDVSNNLMSGTPDFEITPNTAKINGNIVWNAGNDGTGSGLDADLLDGYHLSTTRNAANTVPVRDGNGYLQLGWINTTSGVTTATINKIYVSNDNYIRYITPATFRSQVIDGNYLPLAGGTMSGAINMGDNDIDGIDELKFSSGTKLGDGSATNYLRLTYANSAGGGIQLYDNNGQLQGYLYADGAATSSFGLLDGTGSWAVRCVEDQYVELRYDNAVKLRTSSTGIAVTGNASTTGDVTIGDELTITTISNATADPDKFLCASGGNKVGYRTGAQVLSDIGGVGSSGVTSVATGGGLDGGTITATGTIEVEYDGVPTNIIQSGFDFTGDTVVSGDYIMISNPGSTSTSRRVGYVTVGDLPFTNNSGDITGVTAGTGLTGGGTSGTVTLNVIGGSGITANANDIAVDSTVIRTTGGQTRQGNNTFAATSTSTSYTNAGVELRESNLSGSSGTAPFISWHWGGVVASSMAIEANGTIAVRNNPGTAYEKFACGNLTAHGGTFVLGSGGVGDMYIGNNATNKYFRFHTNNNQTYFDMNCGTINWREGSSTRYYFYPSSANMTINGTLTQNSDERVKENIVEINDCIGKVQAMKGVYYNRTDFNTEVTKVGVIAQDVEAVLPELILEAPDTGLKSVAYAELTAVLINAIKEQQEIIEDLKTRVQQLEK